MFAIVFLLVAALITLVAINNGLRSDLRHYVALSNERWRFYQLACEELANAKQDWATEVAQFAESRDIDGERLAAQADQIVKLRKHCLNVNACVRPQIELMRIMLDAMEAVFPVKYACPKCSCFWRDNGDKTMSLFDEVQRSCEFCEHAPLSELDPLSADGSVIADANPRQDA